MITLINLFIMLTLLHREYVFNSQYIYAPFLSLGTPTLLYKHFLIILIMGMIFMQMTQTPLQLNALLHQAYSQLYL